MLLVQLYSPLLAKSKQKGCAGFFRALFWKSKQKSTEYFEQKRKYYLSLTECAKYFKKFKICAIYKNKKCSKNLVVKTKI